MTQCKEMDGNPCVKMCALETDEQVWKPGLKNKHNAGRLILRRLSHCSTPRRGTPHRFQLPLSFDGDSPDEKDGNHEAADGDQNPGVVADESSSPAPRDSSSRINGKRHGKRHATGQAPRNSECVTIVSPPPRIREANHCAPDSDFFFLSSSSSPSPPP